MKYSTYPKAILLGFLTDIAATFLTGIIIIIVAIVTKLVPLKSFSDNTYLENLPLMIIFILVGSASSFLGGFITGKKTPTHEGFNCIIMGAIGLVLGLFFFNSTPVWYSVISLVIHIPIIYAGGIVAKKSKRQAI